MRPSSIIMFERLYLASLAVVVAQQAAGYFVARDILARMPAEADLPGMSGMFSGFMIGSMIFGLLLAVGVPLLLGWLAARKRTEVAKWLLLVISVISVLMWCAGLVIMLTMTMPAMGAFEELRTMQLLLSGLDGIGELLGIAALVFLFRSDSTAWFRSAGPPASADVFR